MINKWVVGLGVVFEDKEVRVMGSLAVCRFGGKPILGKMTTVDRVLTPLTWPKINTG